MRGGESLLYMSFRLYLTALEYHTLKFQLASTMFVFNNVSGNLPLHLKDVKQGRFSAVYGRYIKWMLGIDENKVYWVGSTFTGVTRLSPWLFGILQNELIPFREFFSF